jgi:DNA-binding transcriptional regulator PaaX
MIFTGAGIDESRSRMAVPRMAVPGWRLKRNSKQGDSVFQLS